MVRTFDCFIFFGYEAYVFGPLTLPKLVIWPPSQKGWTSLLYWFTLMPKRSFSRKNCQNVYISWCDAVSNYEHFMLNEYKWALVYLGFLKDQFQTKLPKPSFGPRTDLTMNE